jgi:uncharacterized protein DUF481
MRLFSQPAWLLLVVSTVPTAAAAVKTDIVVLRNGDRMTGEVRSLDRGQLTFKTDNMGTLAIEWDKIKSVTAAATFEVEDLKGGQYHGSLRAGPGEGDLSIDSASGTQTVPLLEVARIDRLGATFWKRLDGSIDLGLSYTSASDLLALNFSSQVSSRRPGHKLSLSASSTIQRQPDVPDTRRNSLALGYQRLFPDRWVVLTQAQLEQNRELGFDLRTSGLGGGGRYLLQSRRDELLAGLGVDVNREIPVEGAQTTNVELVTALSYNRFAYDFPKIDVYVNLAGFLSLNDWGRQRLELNAQLKRELLRDFTVSLQGYESYDSRPATANARKNDYGITFALGWTF